MIHDNLVKIRSLIEKLVLGIQRCWIRVTKNIKYIFFKGASFSMTTLTVVGFYFTFFSPSEQDVSKEERLWITIATIFLSYFAAIMWVALFRRKRVVYVKKAPKIYVRYGSIIDTLKKYEKWKKQARFIIPVNRCFDTKVDDVLVEKTTIHGQFILSLEKLGMNVNALEKIIGEELEKKKDIIKFDVLDSLIKREGKMKRFPIGTVVEVITKNGNVIYLAAFAKFENENEKIIAKTDMYEYLSFLQMVIDYSCSDGRNLPIFMPPVGCGNSRLGIELEDAVQKIVTSWKINSDKLRSDVTIMIPVEASVFVQLDKFH